MHSDLTLLVLLPVLLWLSPFLARRLRLPTAVVEMLLGALSAYMGLLQSDRYFDLIAEVGFLYLMFLAGMEVNLREIRRSSSAVLQSSILFLGAMTLFSILFGVLFSLHPVVIVSMPLISVGMVATLTKSYGKEEAWLKTAVIVGVMGEVLSVAALTVFDVYSVENDLLHLMLKIGLLILFFIVIIGAYRLLHLLFWWYPELKTILIPRSDTAEQDIRMAMALFFLMIAVMLALGLELALGAFIAGAAISSFFHHEKKLEEKMSALGFGFLVPLFFIHVGASFDLRALMIPQIVSGGVLIALLAILARILAASMLQNLHGARQALLSGLALSMPLTLLVAVATIGYENGLMQRTPYYQLILGSILEVLFVMVIIGVLTRKR